MGLDNVIVTTRRGRVSLSMTVTFSETSSMSCPSVKITCVGVFKIWGGLSFWSIILMMTVAFPESIGVPPSVASMVNSNRSLLSKSTTPSDRSWPVRTSMLKISSGSPSTIWNVISEFGPSLSASKASRGGVVTITVPGNTFSVREDT